MMTIEESVHATLEGVLEANNGNMRKAALALGVNPTVFWSWMQGRGMEKRRSLFEALDRAGAILSVPGKMTTEDVPDSPEDLQISELAETCSSDCWSAIVRLRDEKKQLRELLNKAEGKIEGLMTSIEVLSRCMATQAVSALHAKPSDLPDESASPEADGAPEDPTLAQNGEM